MNFDEIDLKYQEEKRKQEEYDKLPEWKKALKGIDYTTD